MNPDYQSGTCEIVERCEAYRKNTARYRRRQLDSRLKTGEAIFPDAFLANSV